MKALLVTSRITFVPQNYDMLINELAANPNIGGLLVLDNLSKNLALRIAGTFIAGAYAIGRTLSANLLGNSSRRRKRAYAKYNKPLWVKKSINCPSVTALVKEHEFDLIINARTRCIYSNEILNAPHYGCINIHHGLLPEQRGTMCDLWALVEKRDAGFSIHKMTSKLDDGDIIEVVKTSSPGEYDQHQDAKPRHTSYPEYLAHTAKIELKTITALLDRLQTSKTLVGQANHASAEQTLFKDPSPAQIKYIKKHSIGV